MATQAAPSSAVIESALKTLQPIRDLSRNWDVDIASCLEEYLQELVAVPGAPATLVATAGPPNGENRSDTIPNFAQAALILQNSSHVYSRKVEYLHGLVYKALYEFFKSTATGNPKESRRKSTDAAVDEFYEFDPNEVFLLLDDVVPEDFSNQSINLKEDEGTMNGAMASTTNTPTNQSLTRTRLSLGGLSVTRAEQRSSLGGAVSSSQERMLLGTLNNGSLRLVNGMCDVGEDGVLLMPGSQTFKLAATNALDDQSGQERRSLFVDDKAHEGELPLVEDDEDHDNDGPGFTMNDDFNDTNGDNLDETSPAGTKDTLVGVSTQAHHKEIGKKVTFAHSPKRQDKKPDPWALLDPHTSEGHRARPLRKSKTYRLPEGFSLPPSECVTGARTRRNPQKRVEEKKVAETKCLAVQTMNGFLGNGEKLPHIPLNGLLYGKEFEYIWKENRKKKAALRRLERQKALQENLHDQVTAFDEFEDDNDDFGGGYDYGGDDYEEDDYGGGNAGMASMDEAYENAHDGTEGSNSGKTFEELCRAHIQAFAKGAENYALSTQLTDRVSKWQEKLAPILEEEETRGEFDIHKYSEKLIQTAHDGLQRIKRKSDGSIHSSITRLDFDGVTRGCSRSDVCRLFLASLSLANSGNLHIDDEASTFQFDLVSRTVERPMETYRAPSVVDA